MSLLRADQTKPLEGGPSYSLRHRLYRLLWSFVWGMLASWTPPPLHRWRIFLLRLFGSRVSYSAHVYSSVRVWYPPNLTMDAHACLGPDVNCYCMAPIHLKAGAIISQGTHLCAGMHDITDEHFQLICKEIVVGERAWVAAEAFIGPGVAIGDAAVVGARGVVFKSIEPGSVYVGNPARFLRMRG